MTLIDLTTFANNLESINGIWYSKSSSHISYPEEGHDLLFQIEAQSFWFQHRNNCILETLKKYPSPGVFFDIGGGNGVVSLELEHNDIDTVLVEPGKQGALNAKKRGVTQVVCSTLEDAGFKNNSLPALGVFDVLEHIQDDRGFLKHLNRYLKPEGRLYITVPAYNFLWSYQDRYAGHFRRYTLKSINKILNETGFTVEYSTYIFSFLWLPIFLFRSLPGKLGLKKEKAAEKSKRRITKELSPGNRILGNSIHWLCRLELNRLKKSRRIPFGGSCLAVSKKHRVH